MVILVSSRTSHIAVDQQDDLYVSDYYNDAIHKFFVVVIDVFPIVGSKRKHLSKYGYKIKNDDSLSLDL